MDEVTLLKGKVKRLKKSQAEAESLLEKKSLELYESNKKLSDSNSLLEKKMSIISKEIQSLAKFPKENPNPMIRITTEGKVLYANPSSKDVVHFFKSKQEGFSKLISELTEQSEKMLAMKKIVNINKNIFELIITFIEEESYINIYGRNITEQKIAEQGMIKAMTDAEQANKAKSQFLANMSHEIRTPLNGMLGYIRLLEKSGLTQIQNEQLGIVGKSGRLLLSLINDILDFSKIEADKLDLEITKVHLKRSLEDIVEVMAGQVFDKGLEFPVFIDEEIPKYALLDKERLRQVLVNLIGNAVKYTPSGEVSVSMELTKDKKSIHFEIKDTGVGIPQKNIKAIFKAFEQADVSDTRKYGGTGLGLTISQRIVEAMGGVLQADSVEGQGSNFYFTIPLNYVDSESANIEYSDRDFRNEEAVLLYISNSTIQSNLIRRLTSWNVITKVGKKNCDLSWNFEAKEGRSIVVDSVHLNIEETYNKLNELSQSGVHIVVVASAKEQTGLLSKIKFNNFNLISKPIKREDLFNAIKSKEIFVNASVENSDKIPVQTKKVNFSELKILVVEDNLINQQVALAMLEAQGFTAKVANNGKEGVEMHASDSYDVILMDCQMPVMDGFEATKNIRKIDPSVSIIAMTANAFKKTKQECFDVGMNDFVTKPILDDVLAEIIKKNVMKNIA